MTIDAVVFDLDGTLADTLEDIAAAMNHALRRQGLPERPADDYRELVGEGVRRLVERALPPERPDLVEPVLADLGDHYVAHMLDRTRPYPGVPEMLDALVIPAAVLSNKPQSATTWMVDQLFSGHSFATVRGGQDDVPLKPHPAALLAIVSELGVEPSRTAYVGDTRTDMETAVAAGAVPVGVEWGFRDRGELIEHGARAVVASPAELLELLDGRRRA